MIVFHLIFHYIFKGTDRAGVLEFMHTTTLNIEVKSYRTSPFSQKDRMDSLHAGVLRYKWLSLLLENGISLLAFMYIMHFIMLLCIHHVCFFYRCSSTQPNFHAFCTFTSSAHTQLSIYMCGLFPVFSICQQWWQCQSNIGSPCESVSQEAS